MKVPSLIMRLMRVVLCLAVLPVPISALTPAQIFEKVKDSVVVVRTLDEQGRAISQGSGVLLPSGKIATNSHVVEGGASYAVGHGEKFFAATLYAMDQGKDIALLSATEVSGKPAQLGKAALLKVGSSVYAVGAPMGLELSISEGIVAQLRGNPPPIIQTTAAISPGSSGGGLFDAEGLLVGLTTLYIDGGQNLNFAMPVEWVREIKPGQNRSGKERGESEWLKRAIALEGAEDWPKLLDWCMRWTKSEPENADAWFSLGNVYSGLTRYNDAINAYRQALSIDPEHAGAWNNLGIAYAKLNRYSDAVDAYRQALIINPEYALAWFNLGNIYDKLERYSDAVDAYRQALSIDSEYTEAWSNLGTVYYQLERNNDAIDAYRQAVSIDPEDARAWFNLGVTYKATGSRTSALSVVKELQRIDSVLADKLLNALIPR